MIAVPRTPRPASLEAVFNCFSKCPDAETVGAPLPSKEAVPSVPVLSRKPSDAPLTHWLLDTLVRSRGVLTALPQSAWKPEAEADSVMACIVKLDPLRAVGANWWWMWRLRASSFDGRAYSFGNLVSAFFTDGLEESNNWFPSGGDLDETKLSDYSFDRLSLAGFAVSLRLLPPPSGGDAGTLESLPRLHQRILLELEVAATGIGPAIFALFVVNSNDDFSSYRTIAEEICAGDTLRGVPPPRDVPGHVAACVNVTQTATFHLGEFLQFFNKVAADPVTSPNLPGLKNTVFESTLAVARQIRKLATLRILKLNLSPEQVVFCPQLDSGDSGSELVPSGYGHHEFNAVKGLPKLFDFDPVFTKRWPQATTATSGYDADCAYLVMVLILLSSARAQYGSAVSTIMANRLLGRSPEGKKLEQLDLPEGFDSVDLVLAEQRSKTKAIHFSSAVRSVMPTFYKNRQLTFAYEQVASDFNDLIQTQALQQWGTQNDWQHPRPVFQLLVAYLSASTEADTKLFEPPRTGGDLFDLEHSHTVAYRLDAVRLARVKRMSGGG